MGAPPVETHVFEVPAYGAPPPTGGDHSHGASNAQQGVLAGFGARLGASVLDGILLTLVLGVVAAALARVVASRWETVIEPCKANPETTLCEFPTDSSMVSLLIAVAVFLVVTTLVGILYHALMIAKSGQTPGRRVLGIKVVSAETGQPPSFGKSLLRWITSGISFMVCGLGYLWMLWDSQNQTWHDKVATTVVVRA